MSRFTKLSAFPDINVWIALAYRQHSHHSAAHSWLRGEQIHQIFFSRITMMGVLRLLTTQSIMAESVCTQTQAWNVYDRLCEDDRVRFMPEPNDFQEKFRSMSQSNLSSPKLWADYYLAAFADTADLTLVTFDQAFRSLRNIDVLVI